MLERFASALDGSSAALVVLEVSVLEDCEYIHRCWLVLGSACCI